MLDLSIIIVNTNNKKLLEECLTSIYDHTHLCSFEIIVVDNASTDGSCEMIKTKFPSVILIENVENIGFIKASNLGLKIYQGRYAMLLNDDTIVKEAAFDLMIEFMEANQKFGACGPRLLNVDKSIQKQGGFFGSRFYYSKEPKSVAFVIGACIMVRRKVIDKVGILDENLFFYNDDIDWCKRIRDAGWEICFYPLAEVIHYGGYSSKRIFNRRLFVEGFKGGIYYCRKHYGTTAWIFYRFILTISMLLAIPLLIISFPLKREKFFDRLLAYFDVVFAAIGG